MYIIKLLGEQVFNWIALDTKSLAKRYCIVVEFTMKNVYYFEKKYGVGVKRDTVQAHKAGTMRAKSLCSLDKICFKISIICSISIGQCVEI